MDDNQLQLFTLEDFRDVQQAQLWMGKEAIRAISSKLKPGQIFEAWPTYVGLCFYADSRGIVSVKIRELCKLMCLARSTFFRHINRCIELGIVERKDGGYKLIDVVLDGKIAALESRTHSLTSETPPTLESPTHETPPTLGSPTGGTGSVQNTVDSLTSGTVSLESELLLKNNTKKKKRTKTYISGLFDGQFPDWVPEREWQEYKNMRALRKRPMTPFAEELELKTLKKLIDDGENAVAILQRSITKGWIGLFSLKGDEFYRRGSDNGKTRKQQQFDDAADEVERRIHARHAARGADSSHT